MRKTAFAYAKTKAQIKCAVTAQLISAFVMATLYSAIPLLSKSNIILCGYTARLLSDLVGNPVDRFSRDAAHYMACMKDNYKILYISSP